MYQLLLPGEGQVEPHQLFNITADMLPVDLCDTVNTEEEWRWLSAAGGAESGSSRAAEGSEQGDWSELQRQDSPSHSVSCNRQRLLLNATSCNTA